MWHDHRDQHTGKHDNHDKHGNRDKHDLEMDSLLPRSGYDIVGSDRSPYVIRIGGVRGLIILLYTMSTLAFSVLAYMAGFLNMHTVCNETFANISLSLWLIIYGSVEFATILTELAIFVITIYFENDRIIGYINNNFKWIYSLFIVWNIVWGSIGGILIFHTDLPCLHNRMFLWGSGFSVWMWIVIHVLIFAYIFCKKLFVSSD